MPATHGRAPRSNRLFTIFSFIIRISCFNLDSVSDKKCSFSLEGGRRTRGKSKNDRWQLASISSQFLTKKRKSLTASLKTYTRDQNMFNAERNCEQRSAGKEEKKTIWIHQMTRASGSIGRFIALGRFGRFGQRTKTAIRRRLSARFEPLAFANRKIRISCGARRSANHSNAIKARDILFAGRRSRLIEHKISENNAAMMRLGVDSELPASNRGGARSFCRRRDRAAAAFSALRHCSTHFPCRDSRAEQQCGCRSNREQTQRINYADNEVDKCRAPRFTLSAILRTVRGTE